MKILQWKTITCTLYCCVVRHWQQWDNDLNISVKRALKFGPTCPPPLNYVCEFQHIIPPIDSNRNPFNTVDLGTERANSHYTCHEFTFMCLAQRTWKVKRLLSSCLLLAYLLTYLITYLLTYLLNYLLTYLLVYLHNYLLTYLLNYLITYLLTYLLIYLLTCLLTCLFTYIITYLHTYLITYLLACLLT